MTELSKKPMRVLRVQPAAFTDQITGDGTELTKLPYPYFVSEDGTVGRQDFWKGSPIRMVGFAADLAKQEMTLWWHQILADPQKAVGLYPVVEYSTGTWFTVETAVESITEELDDDADGGPRAIESGEENGS